jgi:Type III restriction enzyme, res subunit
MATGSGKTFTAVNVCYRLLKFASAKRILFPLVLIPAYGVPRSLLIHSYSLIGLLRKTSQQHWRAESLHSEINAVRA